MGLKKQLLAGLGLGLATLVTGGYAAANDALVVYIECSGPDGARTQGSGVLVNETGLFLTARHVVPKGSDCRASVGDNTKPLRKVRQNFRSNKIAESFDARLMEFGASEVFPNATACALSPALKGTAIVAKGFHADSFGSPSETEGVLSVAQPDPSGMIETTAMTVNGKSGGPVFLKDTNTIVGIIAGAQFTAQGIVSSYKMLAVDALLGDLDVLKQPQSCGQAEPIGPSTETEGELPDTTIAAVVPDPKPDLPPAPAMTAESELGDPNFPDHVTGLNVSYIEFDVGHFKQTGPGQWVLHDVWHNTLATLTEQGRDEVTLVLVNDQSGAIVNFDGEEQMIYTLDNFGVNLIDQRPMTKVE